MPTKTERFQTPTLNTIYAACLDRNWTAWPWNEAEAQRWDTRFQVEDEFVGIDFPDDVRLMICLRGDRIRVSGASHFWLAESPIENYQRDLAGCLDEVWEQAVDLAKAA